jgi:ribosomal protein S7
MKKGQLAVVEKEFEKTYSHAKLHFKISPALVILETIEKIKPIFKLKSVMQRGKKKDFPIFLDKYKQRLVAIKNFRNLVSTRKE